MSTLDKTQKDAKRALAKAAKAAEEAEHIRQCEAARAFYVASVPKRLMDATALAGHVGVSTEVNLTETGPSVRFHTDGEHYIESTITYDVDEWELESLEGDLTRIKEQQDAREARKVLAQNIFDKLDVHEKTAIRENIHYLR